MKISKRTFGILFIFVIVFILNTFSFATYRTAVLSEQNIKSIAEKLVLDDYADLSAEEQETLDLINKYRIKNGLTELKALSSLQDVAYLKAIDLVQNNYFSHTSVNLGTPFEMLEDYGIDYMIAGENLAGNTTPERAVAAWINSPSHKANILEKNFSYTGIVGIDSPGYGKIYVQLCSG